MPRIFSISNILLVIVLKASTPSSCSTSERFEPEVMIIYSSPLFTGRTWSMPFTPLRWTSFTDSFALYTWFMLSSLDLLLKTMESLLSFTLNPLICFETAAKTWALVISNLFIFSLSSFISISESTMLIENSKANSPSFVSFMFSANSFISLPFEYGCLR